MTVEVQDAVRETDFQGRCVICCFVCCSAVWIAQPACQHYMISCVALSATLINLCATRHAALRGVPVRAAETSGLAGAYFACVIQCARKNKNGITNRAWHMIYVHGCNKHWFLYTTNVQVVLWVLVLVHVLCLIVCVAPCHVFSLIAFPQVNNFGFLQ